MKRLVDTNLIKIVEDSLSKDKKLLGICLGMQLLFAESNEFIKTKGFSYFKSNIECFKDFKVKKKTFIDGNKVKFKENFFDNEDTRAFFNENIIILYIHILLKMITKIIFLERQKMVKKNL